jgi:hypothetical protein
MVESLMNGELETTWKKTALAWFEVVMAFPEIIEEGHEKLQSG